MTRLPFILVFAVIATGMFVIKNRVVSLEGDLERVNARIKSDQEALLVLNAEWSHLNDPSRIRALSARHAGMKPLSGNRVITVSAIAFKKTSERESGIIRVSFAAQE